MHLALLLAVIQPQLPAEPQPEHRHHGLFFRADFGLGFYVSSPGATTVTGGSAGLGVSIGAGLAENFALFASIFSAATANADLSVGSVRAAGTNVSSGIAGSGLGFTYYFMPVNAFLSGTLGVGQATLDQTGKTHTSRVGPIWRLGAGREWFVSSSWGLGLAVYLTGSHNTTQEYPQSSWTTIAPVVAMTATFY